MSPRNRRPFVAILGAWAAFSCTACESESHSTAPRPPAADAGSPSESSRRRQAFDEAYRRGVSLMEAYLELPREKVALNPQAKTDLPAAIRSLDVAISIDPESSTAWWSRGKAEQLLGDHEQAHDAFHRSYQIDGGRNPDSGVQLVLECLETGREGEAVQVAETIRHAQPDNAGMLANLALAYLINGQIDDAVRTIHAAEAIDPEDEAIGSAKKRVEDVQSGRRPKPQRIGDIAW